MRKIMSVIFAVVLVFGLSARVFAAYDLTSIASCHEKIQTILSPPSGYPYVMVLYDTTGYLQYVFSKTSLITNGSALYSLKYQINADKTVTYNSTVEGVFTASNHIKGQVVISLYKKGDIYGKYILNYSTADYLGHSNYIVQDPDLDAYLYAPVDTSFLESLIDQAGLFQGQNYTSDTWLSMQLILADAKATLNSLNHSQTEIDSMCARLQSAIDGLTRLNVASLEALVAQVKALWESDYTADTWESLQTVLADAESLLLPSERTQTEIDSMCTRLQTAIDGLLRYDASALESLIAQVNTLKKADYTASTWSSLQSVLTDAKALLRSSDLTQAVIDSMYTRLQSAVDGLLATQDGVVSPKSLDSMLSYIVGSIAVILSIGIVLLSVVIAVLLVPRMIRKITKA